MVRDSKATLIARTVYILYIYGSANCEVRSYYPRDMNTLDGASLRICVGKGLLHEIAVKCTDS